MARIKPSNIFADITLVTTTSPVYIHRINTAMLSSAIHMILHFLVPALVAWCFFRKDFKKAYLIMIATMLVDVDHLLAVPLFDPMRCSIGFHPLHSYYIQPLYIAMAFFKPTRYLGLGLIIHMSLDGLDCLKLI